MFINLHIYRVNCSFNGELKDFLVISSDLNAAAEQIADFWARHQTRETSSFRLNAVFQLGAILDVTGMAIKRQEC